MNCGCGVTWTIIRMTSHERHTVSNCQSFDSLSNSICVPTSKKHRSPRYWSSVMGIHRWPVNSLQKGSVTRKKLPFDDVIMVTHISCDRHWIIKFGFLPIGFFLVLFTHNDTSKTSLSKLENIQKRAPRFVLDDYQSGYIQYIPRNMHMVFALLCFVVVIHWLIFPYPPGLLHWHCGNLTIAPVPARQPWWIWINTSYEFIMNDCITTIKQSTTKPCAYFLGYTVVQ